MSIPEFPPNSKNTKKGSPEDKNITPIVSSGAVRRKKSFRKQFSTTFIAGDAKTAVQYSIFEIMLPAARDMILETFQQGLEKLIMGDSRKRRSSPLGRGDDNLGYVNYGRMSSRPTGPHRTLSRQARARHSFDEIVLDQRTEAEEVIDKLYELVSKYDSATVADLYELVGINVVHTDHKWGWRDLYGSGVSRVRGGYLLDLPEPEPLD